MQLYHQLIETHSIDAIVLVDGGSDSIMAGDEEGLGDLIEDAVSITAVAGLKELKAKILITVGLGTDRFNQVSDASSLRAISELIPFCNQGDGLEAKTKKGKEVREEKREGKKEEMMEISLSERRSRERKDSLAREDLKCCQTLSMGLSSGV